MTTAELQSCPTPALVAKPAPGVRPWRLPAVDGLRALACMMVYAIHTWEFSGKPECWVNLYFFQVNLAHVVETFPSGVDLFMVLSGFCLFWPMCKSDEALDKWSCGSYVYRRIRRICPPYYVSIAYVILFPQFLVLLMRLADIRFEGREAQFQPNPAWWNILAHLTFVHTAFYETWDGITGAYWSLGLEMQFYLAFPLVVYQFRRRRAATLVGMIVVSIAFRIIMSSIFMGYYGLRDSSLQEAERLCNISFLGRWMQFACGMLAAILTAKYYRTNTQLSWIKGLGLVLLSIGIYVLVFLTSAYYVDPAHATTINALPLWLQVIPTRDILMGLNFSLLVFTVTSSQNFLRPIFELKLLTILGTMSYSIFLIHQTTAWFFSELVRKKFYHSYAFPEGGSLFHWGVMLTGGLAAVLMVGIPFFMLFEKPFMTPPKKKVKTVPLPTTAPPATESVLSNT